MSPVEVEQMREELEHRFKDAFNRREFSTATAAIEALAALDEAGSRDSLYPRPVGDVPELAGRDPDSDPPRAFRACEQCGRRYDDEFAFVCANPDTDPLVCVRCADPVAARFWGHVA